MVGTFLKAYKFRVLPVAFIDCDPDLLEIRMFVLHGCLDICVAQGFHERRQVARSF
jgi:hypothetical protein